MLTQLDKENIISYIRAYSGCSPDADIDLERVLRYWDVSKNKLYNDFGKQYILSKEIVIQKDQSILSAEVTEKLLKDAIGQSFVNALQDAYRENSDRYWNFERSDKVRMVHRSFRSITSLLQPRLYP
jgi:hypothetical protein